MILVILLLQMSLKDFFTLQPVSIFLVFGKHRYFMFKHGFCEQSSTHAMDILQNRLFFIQFLTELVLFASAN